MATPLLSLKMVNYIPGVTETLVNSAMEIALFRKYRKEFWVI